MAHATIMLLAYLGLLVSVAAADQSPSLGVLGLGSNVVDRFFRVRGADGLGPVVGEKGYFASEGEVVGGVTLNHLSWASALGVPTALAALQGEDEAGRMIRESMTEHGVSRDALTVSASSSSSVSHVILDETGERTILMAPHATATLSSACVERLFGEAVARAALVTTEISQVPLSGVVAFLTLAKQHGTPSVLDVDVTPSVAAAAAALCSDPAETLACAKLPTVLKVTQPSAVELLGLAGVTEVPEAPDELAAALQRATGVPLVAVTAGGAGGALAAAGGAMVMLAPPPVDTIIDTTGAGDAFLGGLLAALWRLGVATDGTLPADVDALRGCLHAANCAGAACCEVLGGLPPLGSSGRDRVVELLGGKTAAADLLPELIANGVPGVDGAAEELSRADADARSEAAIVKSLDADALTAASLTLNSRLHASVLAAAAEISATCSNGGTCLVSGLGKSGAVATRLAASLTSTGCRAHFVHAAEWAHGDLGKMPSAGAPTGAGWSASGGTTLIAISHSGKTAEVVGACKEAAARGVRVVLIAGGGEAADASPAGRVANHVLSYELPDGVEEPYGGAPTASIVAQEVVANALICSLADRAGFTSAHFRTNHPGGALGENLSKAA